MEDTELKKETRAKYINSLKRIRVPDRWDITVSELLMFKDSMKFDKLDWVDILIFAYRAGYDHGERHEKKYGEGKY